MNEVINKIKTLFSQNRTTTESYQLLNLIKDKTCEIPELADIISELLSLDLNSNKQIRVEINTKDFSKGKNNTSEYIIKR